MTMLRNFTAVLPVTCNADCGFCPEKEMEVKAKASGQKEKERSFDDRPCRY